MEGHLPRPQTSYPATRQQQNRWQETPPRQQTWQSRPRDGQKYAKEKIKDYPLGDGGYVRREKRIHLMPKA
jgi:hypothetical protein